MLNVRRLILLRELESLGSLTAVARAQGISPAAVSQQLAKLEEEAGLALLEQVGRRVALTHMGRALARRADEITVALEGAQADLDVGRGGVQGTARLSAFGSFVTALFPAVVRRMVETHPHVVVELRMLEPGAALNSVLGRRADVAITDEYSNRPAPVDSRVRSVHLFRDPVLAYSPWPVDSLRALAEVPWVFEPVGTTAAEWAKNVCRQAGFEPVIRYESPDLRFHHDLTTAGVAASFLPDMVFRNPTNPPFRPQYPVRWPEQIAAELHRDVYAVTRRGAHFQPVTRALLEQVQAVGITAE